MLFIQNFSVLGVSRLSEFIEFKNNNLSKTNFKYEANLSTQDGSYNVSVRSSAQDIASLEVLFDKWDKEDKSAKSQNKTLNLVDKLFVNLRAS